VHSGRCRYNPRATSFNKQTREALMLRGTWKAIVVAGFLAWPVLSMAQDAPRPALDSAGLLPPSRDPANVPSAADKSVMVPAVPMDEMMRQAIRLFDAGSDSQRFYDLANCLDGLTFGFGNWPQPEIGSFFHAMMADPVAGPPRGAPSGAR
jgi:hypothetical protein